MRFRRRSDAPSESEPDESAWARPAEGEPAEDLAPPDPGPSPEWETLPEVAGEEFRPEAAPAQTAEEPAWAPAEEQAEEPAWEPAEEPAEEPAWEPAEEPAEEPAWEPAEEPVEEPLPVEEVPPAVPEPAAGRWSGERDHVVPSAEGTVRAAGGVVWSRWQGGLRVVVVHRPRYDDWSLPKGKAGPGENDAECALREVREETGLACSLGEELGTTTYYDRHGRLKTVHYYAMQPLGGGESPQNEVDEVRWLGLEEAKRLLSYERDVDMLDALAAIAPGLEDPEAPPAG